MPKTLGSAIRAVREKAGVTRHALAKVAMIDPAVLARIEQERRAGVQFATICRLSEALGVSLDDLAIAAGLKRSPGDRKASKDPSSFARVLTEARSLHSTLKRAQAAVERLLKADPY